MYPEHYGAGWLTQQQVIPYNQNNSKVNSQTRLSDFQELNCIFCLAYNISFVLLYYLYHLYHLCYLHTSYLSFFYTGKIFGE